ncbi:MAG: molybdopterin synthase sulfur carrier subunit [Candidatus Marinimicrobia bacterium]|nr:molybdopterin synthase sulfur carrier subunit [Candidatus Neomarinimicrobiota bacterium]|tara:strand:+ start:15147 stop:15392 length:246 start_codon:yes stop_codon:yes gene_type:complete
MIKIKIKCFSQVRYALGKDEIALELDEGTTSDDLEKMIREKALGKLENVTLGIAINKKYVLDDTKLNDGDEIAFIPPVQGG